MPSVEQSSTTMICLRMGRRGPAGGSRGCVFLLVVDGDHDREDQVLGDRGRCPACGRTSRPALSMSQFQPLGVARRTRRDRARAAPIGRRRSESRSVGEQTSIARGFPGLRPDRPAAPDSRRRRGDPWSAVTFVEGPARIDSVQDKRRPDPREAGSRRPDACRDDQPGAAPLVLGRAALATGRRRPEFPAGGRREGSNDAGRPVEERPVAIEDHDQCGGDAVRCRSGPPAWASSAATGSAAACSTAATGWSPASGVPGSAGPAASTSDGVGGCRGRAHHPVVPLDRLEASTCSGPIGA